MTACAPEDEEIEPVVEEGNISLCVVVFVFTIDVHPVALLAPVDVAILAGVEAFCIIGFGFIIVGFSD